MAVECVKHGIPTAEVPITYRTRPEETESKLNPFRDGATIWWTLYSLAKTNNPLFYLGSVGAVSPLSGVGVAAFVGYEWVVHGISHGVFVIVAASGIPIGRGALASGSGFRRGSEPGLSVGSSKAFRRQPGL